MWSVGAVPQELIEQHLSLVQHVVLQVAVHFPRYVDRQELARAGALGLVEAARRVYPTPGGPFDRYAARRTPLPTPPAPSPSPPPPPAASAVPSSTPSAPQTGPRARCGRSAASSS